VQHEEQCKDLEDQMKAVSGLRQEIKADMERFRKENKLDMERFRKESEADRVQFREEIEEGHRELRSQIEALNKSVEEGKATVSTSFACHDAPLIMPISSLCW
jgi:uncharacterized protein (DUF342 family)